MCAGWCRATVLTCYTCDRLQTLEVRAPQEVDRHGAGPVGARLPVNQVGRACGDLLILGWLRDGIEAGSLGEHGAREGEDGGGDGEKHVERYYMMDANIGNRFATAR